MLEFIPVKNTLLLQKYDIQLENLGKSTGFMGCGKKIYLVFDQHKKEWGVTRLDFIQRILRYFGFYKATYKEVVGTHLHQNPCLLKNEGFIKRIQDIWGIHFPTHLAEKKAGSDLLTKKPAENLNEFDGDLQKVKIKDHAEEELEEDEIPDDLSSIHSQSDDEDYNSSCDENWLKVEEDLYFDLDEELEDEQKLTSSSYNPFTHSFKRDPVVLQNAEQFKQALKAADLKNIRQVTPFGNWIEMDYNIDVPNVINGKSMQLLEKMAIEHPELGHYLYLNIRGNGECGYRSIVTGLIYHDCIRNDRIDELKASIQNAFDTLEESWNDLPFKTNEKEYFALNTYQTLFFLDEMKKLDKQNRIASLQDESMLTPFLNLIRCISVSETKLIEKQKPEVEDQNTAIEGNKILEQFALSQEEKELMTYALSNYSLDDLISNESLIDKEGYEKQNLQKETMKTIVKKAQQSNPYALNKLMKLIDQRYEIAFKNLIINSTIPETLELGISLNEFLRQKALGNADSHRSFWALGSDFTAIGFALNKNIGWIYRDAFKENAYDIYAIFRNKPADFYGFNLTGEIHYDLLLPLV